MRDASAEVGWVNTRQQLADALARGGVRAPLYLRHVLRTGRVRLAGRPDFDKILKGLKRGAKGERREARARRRRWSTVGADIDAAQQSATASAKKEARE